MSRFQGVVDVHRFVCKFTGWARPLYFEWAVPLALRVPLLPFSKRACLCLGWRSLGDHAPVPPILRTTVDPSPDKAPLFALCWSEATSPFVRDRVQICMREVKWRRSHSHRRYCCLSPRLTSFYPPFVWSFNTMIYKWKLSFRSVLASCSLFSSLLLHSWNVRRPLLFCWCVSLLPLSGSHPDCTVMLQANWE